MRELKWRAERMRPTSSRKWFGRREGWAAFSVRPCRRKPIRPSSHLRCWFRILKTDYLIVFKQRNNESFAAQKRRKNELNIAQVFFAAAVLLCWQQEASSFWFCFHSCKRDWILFVPDRFKMFCKVKACHEKALRSLLSVMLFYTETKKDLKNMF